MCAIDSDATTTTQSQEILRVVGCAYEEVTGRRLGIQPSARLVDDLELNSLQRYEMLIVLEEEWDVELVDDPDITSAQTVGQLTEMLIAVVARREDQ